MNVNIILSKYLNLKKETLHEKYTKNRLENLYRNREKYRKKLLFGI